MPPSPTLAEPAPHLPIAPADATARVRQPVDPVAAGILIIALIMFAAHVAMVLPDALLSIAGKGPPPDPAIVSALLLNAALILLGYRRYRDLKDEVAERREAEAQARLLAFTDPLTGLLNRRSILPEIDRMLTQARASALEVAFIMVDVDHFKRVNDLNGHRAGDALLVRIAGRIREEMPEDGFLARIGGDEFACAFTYDPRNRARIDRIASRIVLAARDPVPVAGGALRVTLSSGIATSAALPACVHAAADELLHMADIAMYHAKKCGRDRYDWYAEELERELKLRSELENGIRRGTSRREFVPYYEQQVDLETGALTGFEMVPRWHSPTLGLVSAEIFIPVAEEMGVIAELSEAVIAQALHDARDWDASLALSVNISALQLRDPWFAQKFLKLLAEARFPPERLEIEITEKCLAENLGLVRSVIASLKNQGVRVSLDDFGTGASSVAQLSALPFDRIKMHRSFVARLARGGDTRSVLSALSAIGEGLHLPVIAGGVEDESVRDTLRRIGNFRGQGSLYGRPEPAEQVRARLES